MDFNSLGEAFGTVGISLFTYVGLFSILYSCMTLFYTLRGDTKRKSFFDTIIHIFSIRTQVGNQIWIPILVTTLCTGILIELHTRYYADSPVDSFLIPTTNARICDSIFPFNKFSSLKVSKEETVRWETLVTDESEDCSISRLKLTPLGHAVVTDLKKIGYPPIENNKVLNSLLSQSAIDSPLIRKKEDTAIRNVILCVNQLYYDCKTWCLNQNNYFTELRAIEKRIQFSRSLAYISFCFMLLLIFLILALIVIYTKYLIYHLIWPSHTYRKNKTIYNNIYRREIFRLTMALFFYSFMYVVSSKALYYTQYTFTQRVFGYYVSTINNHEYFQLFLDKKDEQKSTKDSLQRQ